MHPPNIDVVVLNYNGKKLNEACLSSLKKNTGTSFNIMFVDNASTDGSLELVKKNHPDLEYIENDKNLFFTGGNNVALRRSLERKSKYIFIVNNDTVVDTDCIASLEKFMDENPSAGACQPLLCSYNNPDTIASAGCRLGIVGKAWDHLQGESVENAGTTPFEVLGVTGGAMFVRSSALEQAGLFDEQFLMYFEDVDLSLRMRKLNFSLWCIPKVQILHHVSATTATLDNSWYVYLCEKNSWKVLIKNFPFRMVIKGMLLGIPAALLVAAFNAVKGNTNHSVNVLKGASSGINFFLKSINKFNTTVQNNSFLHMVDTKTIYPPSKK